MPPKMKTSKREPSSGAQIDPSDLSDDARKRLVRSDAARKSSSRAIVRRAPPLPEEEEEAEGYDPAAFRRSLSALDFVPENVVDAVVASMLERSAEEEEELEAQRRHVEAANEALLQQPIDASLADPLVVASSDEE